jgi:hypothetical protein
LFVGKGIPNYEINNVKAVRTPLLTKVLQFDELDKAEQEALWKNGQWTRSYDPDTGILRVKMNMNFVKFKKGVKDARENSCRPNSFCNWENNRCECSKTLEKEDPDLYKLCKQDNGQGEHQVCRWAGIDVDCPEGGCYGFSFTLPSTFETENCDETPGSANQCGREIADGGHRPEPMCFPFNELWKGPWIEAKKVNGKSVAGTCESSPVRDNNFCGEPQSEAPVAKNLILGTEDDDYLSGTSENDVIRGLGGDDLIFGLEGDDFIEGGPGDDLIFGGRGDDNLQGNSGDDNIDGYTGNDNLNGGEGFDILDGGSGIDTCEDSEDSFDCEVQN